MWRGDEQLRGKSAGIMKVGSAWLLAAHAVVSLEKE
jgi:hypothetical protein